MNTWQWLCLLLYVWAPFAFLEMGAEYDRKIRKHRWTVPAAGILMLFLFWPVVLPLAAVFKRRSEKKGHKNEQA